MIFSCVLHGAVVTTALGFGIHAGRRLQAPVPVVQIERSLPSAPASATAIEPPAVVVEAHAPADLPVEAPPEPLADAVDAPSSVLDHAPRPAPLAPTQERVRAPSRAAAAPAPVQPPVAPAVIPPSRTEPNDAAASAAGAAAPDVDAEPRADNEPPRYPEEARRRGLEGTVVVQVEVGSDGLVLDVALHTPAAGAELNREALRAVRRWRFEPARRAGAAVATTTLVTIVFRLQDA